MEKVFDFIDKSGAIYVKELQELLRQPSISTDPDGIMVTVAIVKGLLEGISRHVDIIQPYQGGAPFCTLRSQVKPARLSYSITTTMSGLPGLLANGIICRLALLSMQAKSMREAQRMARAIL